MTPVETEKPDGVVVEIDGVTRTINLVLPPRIEAATVEVHGGRTTVYIYTPDLPDSDGGEIPIPGEFIGELPTRAVTDQQVARHVAVACITENFHETIEHLRLNGERIAAPHPGKTYKQEEEMWTWLVARIKRLVDDYVAKFPV